MRNHLKCFIALLLSVTVVFCFASCGSTENETTTIQEMNDMPSIEKTETGIDVVDELETKMCGFFGTDISPVDPAEFCSFLSEFQYAFMDIDVTDEEQRDIIRKLLTLYCSDSVSNLQKKYGLLQEIDIALKNRTPLTDDEFTAFVGKYKDSGIDVSSVSSVEKLTLQLAYQCYNVAGNEPSFVIYLINENGENKLFSDTVITRGEDLSPISFNLFNNYLTRKQITPRAFLTFRDGYSVTKNWTEEQWEAAIAANIY